MKKRLISILLLVCLMCGMLCACGKKEITADQAIAIMLEDLGDDADNASTPHVHPGTYGSEKCYNIYVTVDGESWVYVISTDGEILGKTLGSHSH